MEKQSSYPENRELSTADRTVAITAILRGALAQPGIRFYEQDFRFNRGDLVAVKDGGSVTEYEVKSLSSDLWTELRVVRDVRLANKLGLQGTAMVRHLGFDGMNEDDKRKLVQRFCIAADTSKWRKHSLYLDSGIATGKPDYFLLAVEPKRAVRAHEALIGTPYGLVVVDIDKEMVTFLKVPEAL